MDLLLTDYDLDLTDGELSFVNGGPAIGQDVQMRLRTWLGETVYDTTAGVPWIQAIFAEKNPDLNSTRFILERQVLSTLGVTGITLALSFDSSSRTLTISGEMESIDGEIDFTLEIQP